MVASCRVKMAISAALIGFALAAEQRLGLFAHAFGLDTLLPQLRFGHGLADSLNFSLARAAGFVRAVPGEDIVS